MERQYLESCHFRVDTLVYILCSSKLGISIGALWTTKTVKFLNICILYFSPTPSGGEGKGEDKTINFYNLKKKLINILSWKHSTSIFLTLYTNSFTKPQCLGFSKQYLFCVIDISILFPLHLWWASLLVLLWLVGGECSNILDGLISNL